MKKYFHTAIVSCIVVAAVHTNPVSAEEYVLPVQFNKVAQAAQQQTRVDPEQTPELLETMEQYQFERKYMIQIQSAILEARKQGLPSAPLESKVHEGISKNITDRRIARAVDLVHSRYETAYAQAATITQDKEQRAALGKSLAEANAAGMKESDCQAIVDQLQQQTKTMEQDKAYDLAMASVQVARDMSRMNVQSSTTASVVNNALQQSYQIQDMEQLRETFKEQNNMASADEIARGFSSDISMGVSSGNLGENTGGSGGPGESGGNTGGNADGAGGSGGSDGSGGDSGGGSDGSGGSGGESGGGSDSGGGQGGDSGGGSGGGGAGGSGGNSGGGNGR